MPLDSTSGTWIYATTDTASPAHTLLNRLANSVRDTIVAIKARLTAIETQDSGLLLPAGGQSIPSGGANTTVTLSAGAGDLSGGVSFASNGLRVAEAGWYHVSAQVALQTTTAAVYKCHVLVNGTITASCEEGRPGAAYVHVGVSRALRLPANAVVTMQTSNGSGAAAAVHNGLATYLSLVKVG